MFLESLYTYSLVAYVVKKNGMLSREQNTLAGWGMALSITLLGVGLCYDDYGGEYHCWLQVSSERARSTVADLIGHAKRACQVGVPTAKRLV